MSRVIEYLKELDLLEQDKINRYIWNSAEEDIYNLIIYIRDLIDGEYEQSKYSPFIFVPNGDISGTGGCVEINCRIKRARRFATLAALYADKVYLQLEYITSEHFEEWYWNKVSGEDEDYVECLMKIESDLTIISIYAELISKKIVCLTPVHQSICKTCFKKMIFGKNTTIDLDKIQIEYRKKAQMVLVDFNNDSAEVTIKNIDEFFPDHELTWTTHDKEELRILRREKVGGIIKDKRYTKKFIHSFIEGEIVNSCYSAKYCNDQKARLITNKISEAMFLGVNNNSLANEIKVRLDTLPQYDMPLVNNIELKNIINLREQEAESFNKYRIALNKAIEEQHKTQDRTDWYKIYDDIIYPEFNNLDMRIKQIKKGRFQRIFANMGVVGTVLIANKFGNMINPELFSTEMMMGTTIGTTVLSTGISTGIDKWSSSKAPLQESDYYFLWRLNNSRKK